MFISLYFYCYIFIGDAKGILEYIKQNLLLKSLRILNLNDFIPKQHLKDIRIT